MWSKSWRTLNEELESMIRKVEVVLWRRHRYEHVEQNVLWQDFIHPPKTDIDRACDPIYVVVAMY